MVRHSLFDDIQKPLPGIPYRKAVLFILRNAYSHEEIVVSFPSIV